MLIPASYGLFHSGLFLLGLVWATSEDVLQVLVCNEFGTWAGAEDL